MQAALYFVFTFVMACWVFVIGHQLGWSAVNPTRYAIMEATLPIAYTVAGLSICAVVTAAVVHLRK